jgi:uncharacterized DUF497 family protein
MDIEFDEAKRTLTLEERGLDFAHAGEVFAGVQITQEDDRRDYGEPRFQTMGRLDGEVVMVVWTPRGTARRVISMRKCHDEEQRRFRKEALGRSR